jgi:hypothetical protein
MYKTTRNKADGLTLMICNDCGHAVRLNKLCEKPLQSATDMLKHMAAHNASRAFAPARSAIQPTREANPVTDISPTLPASALHWAESVLQPAN